MSLRKTACAACKAAKRRCDSQFPHCSRCVKQSIDCQYPYPPIPAVSGAPLAPESVNIDETVQADQRTLPESGESSQWEDPPDPEWDFIVLPIRSPRLALQTSLCSTSSSSLSSQPECNMHSTSIAPTPISSNQRLQHSSHRHATRRTSRQPRKRQARAVLTRTSSVPRQHFSGYYPRAADVVSWQYCASQFLSFITTFSTTASTGFILPTAFTSTTGSLSRALAVCAAHETGNRNVFEGLIERETSSLVNSSSHGSIFGPSLDAAGSFREDVARLQAMSLYQTMRLFGQDARQQKIAEGLEPLFASWTRELLLKTRLLEMSCIWPQPRSSLDLPTPQSMTPDTEHTVAISVQADEIEMAYRTVILSYLIRGVYAVLNYRICHVLQEIQELPISVPGYLSPSLSPMGEGFYNPKVNHKILYGDFSKTIAYQPLASKVEYDEFLVLMLVASNGTNVLPCMIHALSLSSISAGQGQARCPLEW